MQRKEEKLTSWVNEYSDMLYSYTTNKVTDAAIAKDIVQETFIAAWRNMDNYTGAASVKTWLFTIAKNKIYDYYRKLATKSGTILATAYKANTQQLFEEDGHWKQEIKPNEWHNSSSMETKEFYTVLDSCKHKLKEIQSAVFSLKYEDGLESEEICKVLAISTSNYWVIVHRAKVQLRVCLEKNWFLT